ncbi:TetR family transcriptional regulator [Paenirhodobacter sp.]|uniref:TetR family transcriptional regulator n=1 Tax=Paenirhodobacter sp. TaxID=1965326 RepID=UPI003B3E1D39
MRRCKADAERTRVAILDAAERVFCERGVGQATLEQVARAAGVTRGAVYWHFKDKDDLLCALHERFRPPQAAMIEAAAQDGHEDPLHLLEMTGAGFLALFEGDESRQRMYAILCAPGNPDDRHAAQNEEMFRLLLQLMRQAREKGLLAGDLSPEEGAVSVMALMNGLMSEWLRSGRCFGLREVGGKLMHRHMAALRA